MQSRQIILILFFTIGTFLTELTILSEQDVVASIGNQSSFDSDNLNIDQLAGANNTAVANVTTDFAAQVFIHKNFTGNNTIIEENTPIIKGPFQDSISSLIISTGNNNTSGYMVEVCEHKSYSGNCMILGPGNHNVETLGWLNDQITSIRALSPEILELKNIPPEIIMNGSN